MNSALRALAPDITYRLELRSGPAPRDIHHGLFRALRLPGDPPKRPIEFDALLKEVLAEQFRVLVCDEAQWMSRTGFEFWRHLWDERHTGIAVVFAGGGNCYQVLRREPMLTSRMYVWQEFDRIPKPEVRHVIAAFHPIWAAAEPGLIDAVDAEAAHGNFRNWANITHHLVTGMHKTGAEAVTEALVHWVYSKIGGM